MLAFLKDKSFYKHTLLALITLVLLFIGWLKYLDYYTLHNKYIQVPDFNNLPISALDSMVEANDIRYVIIDSIFDKNKEKGIVIKQDPYPLTNVKRNRKIYLIINSLQSKTVEFPDIYDLSLRQAIRTLKKRGLEVGKLEYRDDIATNKVLDYKINGIKIEIGQELYFGTIIDLVVGKGLSKQSVIVPNLIGLNRMEANIILKSTSLNIGSEIYESSVKDSSLALIYKQFPIGDEDNTLSIGSVIDLFFENRNNNNP
ncbi:MAG: PASTA domain-containing protein [Flavobacteriales bacterium]|jgi:eukaryotic-like serine/threonine-protein kinase|nr:PASTA domain-containing protein [Flavobacteriales bacterium]MBT5090435.1 PASTA domain-containing protein [Flavobacteriales bacterium]